MPNRNKEKGSRLEMAVCKAAESFGLKAYRVAGSGNIRGGGEGDVNIYTPSGKRISIECKARKEGFKFIYDSLGLHDALVIHEVKPGNTVKTAKEKLAVLPLDKYLELLTLLKEPQF